MMLIKKRIYISLLLFSLLPLLLISFLTEQVAKNSLRQIISKDFQVLTQEKANAIGRQLDERINETLLLAKHPGIITAVQNANRHYQEQNIDKYMQKVHKLDKQWINSKGKTELAKSILNNELSQLLKDIQARRPDSYGEIFLTDRIGTTLAMTKTLSDYYQGDEYWWQSTSKQQHGMAYLDDRGFDQSVGAIVIGVVVPIHHNNKIIGVFKINYRVKSILQIVSDANIENGYELILSRSDGTIISSNKNTVNTISNVNNTHSDWLSASHPMKHKFTTQIIEDAIVALPGENIQEKTWNVIYRVDKEIAFASLDQLYNTAIILAIIAFILATMIGFLLSRAITQPLETLNQGINIIGSGNLTHRIVLKAKNEFGILAQSFNKMTQELQDTLTSRDELNQEVSERKQAQAELENLRYYLHEMLDAMSSIVVGVDKEGVVNHCNRQAILTTEVKSQYAIGKKVSDLLNMFSANMEEILNAVKTTQRLNLLRVSYRIKNRYFYANLFVYPLTAKGIEGAVIRIDDISEQVQMQQAVFQTEKMLSVGSLAKGMAHELNNPLGGMLQGIQNIRRRLSAELEQNITIAEEQKIDLQKVQNYFHQRMIYTILDSIEEAGKRASVIIANMMSFSQTEKSCPGRCDLAKLMDEVLDLARIDYDMKVKFGFSHINIIRDYQENLPMVMCICSELKQVILNILRNSAQALSSQIDSDKSHKEPSIIIRLNSLNNSMNIEIEDNGSGMESETIKRIFEPFYTTQMVGQGTGLGLSIAYYLIHEQHSGDIKVKSMPGHGTNMIIQLPLESA